MHQFVLSLSQLMTRLATIILWLSGFALVLMTVFIGWQVWGRFVLNDTPTWTETSAMLLMGWFIFLGAAVGLREGNHLSFDVFLYLLPEGAKRWCHTLSDLVVLAFAIGMVVFGLQLAGQTWRTTLPNLGITGAASFFSLIIGGVLMILLAIERLLRRAVGLQTARFGDSVEET